MNVNDGRVVSNFVLQALAGQPITVYGEGQQTRSFCYVSDLVEGLIRLMNSDAEATPVNLGNPNERTIAELAQKIIAMTDSSSQLKYEPLPQDDPTRRKPDIGRARELIDWEPQVSLDDGLSATIDYFRKVTAQS